MDMHMSFYLSSTVYDFLFPGANVTTTWGMVSLCLGLCFLSLLAEGFKVVRSQLLKVAVSSKTGCRRREKPERIRFHVLQSFLHIIHLTMGYILMLAVMTYNAYFTFAVVGGAALGYYCFALFDLPGKILGTSDAVVTKTSSIHSQTAEEVPLLCMSPQEATKQNALGESEKTLDL